MNKNVLIIIVFLTCMFTSCKEDKNTISLSGEWKVALDSADVGLTEEWYKHEFDKIISLPGTTDMAELGDKNTLEPSLNKPQVLHLTRKYSYVGPAWYSKVIDIPLDWEGKEIEMKLERVIWNTSVWINDVRVNHDQESLIAPHIFDLTDYISSGMHKITIRIDNRKQYDISVNDLGHAYTNDTQVMWNGVLGEMLLTAKDLVSFDDVHVYPNIQDNNILVKTDIKNDNKARSGKINLSVYNVNTKEKVYSSIEDIKITGSKNRHEFVCSFDQTMDLWSEFNPALYELDISLTLDDIVVDKKLNFGMREIKNKGKKILLNNNPIFLRGTLECCIFPLTGHPPMEKEGWEKVFVTARDWGLNHLRFHSWCPPRAAFEVADSLGFYLQVELPLWSVTVGDDKPTNDFLYSEADRIISEYGNHPSFCLFSLGNELQTDFEFMAELLKYIKDQDSRHLYTTTSYTFEPGHGDWPEALDDFFITQRTKKGWVRGQGLFDSQSPRFDEDYSKSIEDMPVPLITHEIGQYAVYPNLKEIDKYTGTLDPLNFKGVYNDLLEKGLLDKSDSYLMSSGKLAELLYKEEIERAIKTDGCSGIQLLDLHDFPGQGTALVGLLDAFWDSKGITESSVFRQFCAPVVPLVDFSKAVYSNDEQFSATIQIANYSADIIRGHKVLWRLENEGEEVITQGEISTVDLSIGLNRLTDTIILPINEIKDAGKYTLRVTLDGTEYTNSWNIWVYPNELPLNVGDVIVTTSLEEAKQKLDQGRKVLLVPDYKMVEGLEGKFVPVFWSPVHFPNQAGTMGIMCDPSHKVFKHFPTDSYTNWQWWSLLKSSKTVVLDDISSVDPLIEVVDSFTRNRRLSNMFEAKIGSGSLVFCSIDVLSDWENRPEAKQLYYSILEYMNSSEFVPNYDIELSDLINLLKKNS